MNIINQLEELGLNEKSAAAYIALLRLQEANAHQVAIEAKLERTTIYKILEDLVIKGLAEKSVIGKRIIFYAKSPKQLKFLLEKQGNILEQILPTLFAMQGKKTPKPVIKFYEDIGGIKQALMDTLNCQEKLRRDFASVENIVELLGQRFIDHQVEERVKRKIQVKSLRCLPDKDDLTQKDWYLRKDNREILREVRYLPQKWSFEPVIFVHDNTITIISSKKESYALIIESAELSQAIKILFDIAWAQAK